MLICIACRNGCVRCRILPTKGGKCRHVKRLRKQKGLSQEELAIKLNVVRQTISKWEQGLSVPDSEMLISISDALDTPVSVLLGESVTETASGDAEGNNERMDEIAEKLELINLQLARGKEKKRTIWRWIFILLCVVTVVILILIASTGNSYLEWDYGNPELAVSGVIIHAFVWIFVRIAPFIILGSVIGICMTIRKH